MAKISILGNAAVITSALKLKDIKLVEKYRPDALILKGGEDGKEPIFGIGTASSQMGSINAFSIGFGSADDNGYATISMVMTIPEGACKKEYLLDKIGDAVANLNKLEPAVEAVVAEVAVERQRMLDNIDVIA